MKRVNLDARPKNEKHDYDKELANTVKALINAESASEELDELLEESE